MKLVRIFTLVAVMTLSGIVAKAEGIHKVSFAVSKTEVNTNRSGNANALKAIESELDAGYSKVWVRAASSPEGSYSLNKRLAHDRAASVIETLKASYPDLTDDLFEIEYINEDWAGVKSYLRNASKPWSEDAISIIDANASNMEALLKDLWVGEAWDDLSKNCFPTLRTVSVHVYRDGDPSVYFSCGSSSVASGFSDNVFNVPAIRSLAKSVTDTLYIYAAASPDGTTSGNLRLASQRAQSVRNLLVKAGCPSDLVKISEPYEDWDGLLEKVRNLQDCPDRDKLLGILDDESLSADQKRAALKSSRAWRYLLKNAMPALRKVTVRTNK